MSSIKVLRKEAINKLLSSKILDKNHPYGMDDACLDVDVLLCHIMKKSRSYVLAHLDETYDNLKRELDIVIEKRMSGLSVPYIVGEKEFFSLMFYVNEDVLIPKADTELLVERAIFSINEFLSNSLFQLKKDINIMDVFTGSGCVAVSVAYSLSKSLKQTYTLIDISNSALEVAKYNAKNLLSNELYKKFHFCLHNATLPFPLFTGKKYDFILANPPYVSHEETISLLSDGRGEPALALDGGIDGFHFFYSLAKHSINALSSNGVLICEVGDNQANNVIKIFKDSGFNECVSYKDLSGKERVVEGKK